MAVGMSMCDHLIHKERRLAATKVFITSVSHKTSISVAILISTLTLHGALWHS